MKISLRLLFILLASQAYGQTKCDRDKIIGVWAEVTNMPGEHANVDSLRQLMKATSGTIGVWDFRPNNTFSYKDSYSGKIHRSGDSYNFDSDTCEIILWTKTKSRTVRKSHHNLEIIYIDTDFMIYKSDDNPKGYYTHLMTRR